MVDDLIDNNSEGTLCKLDMEKAYDHVSWEFVGSSWTLCWGVGFGNKWRK